MNLAGDFESLIPFPAGAIGLVGVLLAPRALSKIQDLNREIRVLKMQIMRLDLGLDSMTLELEVIRKSSVSAKVAS
jgi:hypothetical protein